MENPHDYTNANDLFYCYSDRLHAWLSQLKFRYVATGVNRKTNKNYWTYEKSQCLDEAILLYNRHKHDFN